MLHLHGRGDEIHIAIADGFVVRAEAAGRKARERLGNMLVRAELIGRPSLDRALDLQKRTLRRLGDVLVEEGLVSKAALREMTALQTTETVYRLFHWKSGTYEFEPGEVEWDRETVTPLRAESVLMEGFRQVDEWPMIRRRITSTAMTFERLGALEPARTGRAGRAGGRGRRRGVRRVRRGAGRAEGRVREPRIATSGVSTRSPSRAGPSRRSSTSRASASSRRARRSSRS